MNIFFITSDNEQLRIFKCPPTTMFIMKYMTKIYQAFLFYKTTFLEQILKYKSIKYTTFFFASLETH